MAGHNLLVAAVGAELELGASANQGGQFWQPKVHRNLSLSLALFLAFILSLSLSLSRSCTMKVRLQLILR